MSLPETDPSRIFRASGYAVGQAFSGAMAREEQAIYLRAVIGAPDKDAAVGRAVQHAREYAAGSLASEEEMLEIQYQLGSAGFDEGAARTGSEMVHKLAKFTRGASGQAAEVFGITYNNMLAKAEGTTEEKMTRLGNVLAKTQAKFQIEHFAVKLRRSGRRTTSAAVDQGDRTVPGVRLESGWDGRCGAAPIYGPARRRGVRKRRVRNARLLSPPRGSRTV